MRATAAGKRGSEPSGVRARPDLCPPRLRTSMRGATPLNSYQGSGASIACCIDKGVHDASDGELPFIGNSKAPVQCVP